MKIIYDEKICVRCLACVSESEFGGVTYSRGRIFFNDTCAEDWENIIAICPVGAIKLGGGIYERNAASPRLSKENDLTCRKTLASSELYK